MGGWPGRAKARTRWRRKLRPSQKLTEDASVDDVAVTSVPASTEPNKAGDMVGRITPKGINSPINKTFSKAKMAVNAANLVGKSNLSLFLFSLLFLLMLLLLSISILILLSLLLLLL